jgi:hypothetical protein
MMLHEIAICGAAVVAAVWLVVDVRRTTRDRERWSREVQRYFDEEQ